MKTLETVKKIVLKSLVLSTMVWNFAQAGEIIDSGWGIGYYVDTTQYNELLKEPNVVQSYSLIYASELHRLKNAFSGESVCKLIPGVRAFLGQFPTIHHHSIVRQNRENPLASTPIVELKDVPLLGIGIYFDTSADRGCYVGSAPTDYKAKILVNCDSLCPQSLNRQEQNLDAQARAD